MYNSLYIKETDMGKIIFLDVDGTLIDYDAKLPASAAKAVDMARANDIRYIFVQDVLKKKYYSVIYVI